MSFGIGVGFGISIYFQWSSWSIREYFMFAIANVASFVLFKYLVKAQSFQSCPVDIVGC